MTELLTSFGRAGVVGALAGLVVNWLVEPTSNGGWWLILTTCILATVVINALIQGTVAAWPRIKQAGGGSLRRLRQVRRLFCRQ